MPHTNPAKVVIRTDIVKAAMLVQGWTVEYLAELTGVSPSTVKRSLAGQDPSTAFIAGLWSRAGLNPEKILKVIDPQQSARKREPSRPPPRQLDAQARRLSCLQ